MSLKKLSHPWLLSWSLVPLFPLLLYRNWASVVGNRPHGIRLFFDHWDVSYYFYSAAWAVGPERLFVDAGAEYPLLANLLFGGVRFASSFMPSFPSALDGFAWLWMSISWFAYVAALRLVYTRLGWTSLLMWIAPATLYFALLRYDIYPALACLMALSDFERDKWVRGSALFAVCIALKGYALFLLPALFVFFTHRVGMKRACVLAMLSVGPFLFGHLIVYWLAGMDGMLLPYRYHLTRSVAFESTYGAVGFVGEALGLSSNAQRELLNLGSGGLPLVLQTISAVAAAAFRPKCFDDLVHALLFALLGFVVCATFWSEQFILWIAAIACFSSRRPLLLITALMCWVTIVEFPVLSDLAASSRGDVPGMTMYEGAWRITLVLTSALRVAMMGLAIPWRRSGESIRCDASR